MFAFNFIRSAGLVVENYWGWKVSTGVAKLNSGVAPAASKNTFEVSPLAQLGVKRQGVVSPPTWTGICGAHTSGAQGDTGARDTWGARSQSSDPPPEMKSWLRHCALLYLRNDLAV